MDVDLVRHALTVARSRGFAEVELSTADGAFSARLEPLPPHAQRSAAHSGQPETEEYDFVRSSLVGFYREANDPLRVGRIVSMGEVVAEVTALGIANDVESRVSGEVIEMLVGLNDPVEYGQALAKVRLG